MFTPFITAGYPVKEGERRDDPGTVLWKMLLLQRTRHLQFRRGLSFGTTNTDGQAECSGDALVPEGNASRERAGGSAASSQRGRGRLGPCPGRRRAEVTSTAAEVVAKAASTADEVLVEAPSTAET